MDPADAASVMVSSIESTASSSKTGKVSIIAHSNGGLVAKALINDLKSKNEGGLIDKLVMVAVPQLGTPETIPVLLHGDDNELGAGLVLSKSTARNLGENMPDSYALLPSAHYFDSVKNPVVTFDPSIDQISNLRQKYGNSITTVGGLSDFLIGKDGRSKPSSSDTQDPNIMNSTLMQKEKNTVSGLDSFISSLSADVYQIAGWGRQTTSGTRYFATSHCAITFFICIGNTGLALDHSNMKTLDGDGTVVSPSATTLSSSTGNYFINLKDINQSANSNYDHSTIFEAPATFSILKGLITGSTSTIADVSSSKPAEVPFANLDVSVQSPVSLDAYDSKGNHTGIIANPDPNSDLVLAEQNIPNSSYEQSGAESHVILDGSNNSTIRLQGNGIGTFTLDISKTIGDVSTTTEFADIPMTDETKAEVSISPQSTSTTLMVDADGDGKDDFALKPNTDIDPVTYLGMIKKMLAGFGLKANVENQLEKKIDSVVKSISKDRMKNASLRLKLLLREINDKRWKSRKFTEDQRSEITDMIDNVLDLI